MRVDTEFTFKITIPKFNYEIRVWLDGNPHRSIDVVKNFIGAVINMISATPLDLDNGDVHREITTLAHAVLGLDGIAAVEVIATEEGSFYDVTIGEETFNLETGRIGIVLYKNWP